MLILGILVVIVIIALIWRYFSHLVNPTDTKVEGGINKSLILYFSPAGKTKRLAHLVQQEISADIIEIEGVKEYSGDDKARAFREWITGATPEVKNKLDNIDKYDMVYLAYPIWYDTAPMIMNQVIKKHNFSNKYVVPVVSLNKASQGSGRSIRLIRHHAPRAKVLPRLLLQDDGKDLQRIQEYLKQINIK